MLDLAISIRVAICCMTIAGPVGVLFVGFTTKNRRATILAGITALLIILAFTVLAYMVPV